MNLSSTVLILDNQVIKIIIRNIIIRIIEVELSIDVVVKRQWNDHIITIYNKERLRSWPSVDDM